jgi:hypothetical protein
MSWRLRTSFGDRVIIVRGVEAAGREAAQRIPPLFIRLELRDWLLGADAFSRDCVLEMYEELRWPIFHWRPASTDELQQDVLPEIEEAFECGRLVAFKSPRPDIRADLFPPEKGADSAQEVEPSDWVEIVCRDEEGEPYVGPYQLELPDGRVVSGQLNMGGRVRLDGITAGSCKVTFPELEKLSVSAE